MTELLTAAQMRAIEAAAIASGEVTGLDLMERAGRGVVEAVFEEWPELRAGSFRAVVLCGPGGNGGDGFVVARLLKEWGWEVEVFLYGTPEGMPPDARVNYERWVAMGERLSHDLELVSEPHVIIDALFGIGLTRPISFDDFRHMSAVAFRFPTCPIVAVDVPSGFCADSGRALGEVVGGPALAFIEVDLTVTFHSSKIGHCLADLTNGLGALRTVDIGLGSIAREGTVRLLDRPTDRLAKQLGHKYSHGHALVLSGPPGHGGAARLAARGALRIGAGLVTVVCR